MSFPNLKETISPDPSSNNVLLIPEGNQMFLSMDISTSPFKVPPSKSDASRSDISTNNSAKSAAKESQSSNVSSCFIKSEDLYSMSKIKPNGKLVPNCSDISQFGNGENIMMACENFISQPKVKDELSDVGSPLSTGTKQTGECNQIFENMHHGNNKLTVKDTSQNLKVASLSRRTSPRKRKNETNVCDKELKELCLVPCVVDLGLRVTGHTSLKTLKAYGSEDYATKGSPKSKQISDTQRKTDENIKMLNKGQSHITESQKMPPIKGRQPNASDHCEAVPHSKTRTTRVLQDDQLIYCEDCGREYDGDCPVHGPLVIVEHHAVTTVEYPTLKAVASLPECLSLRPSRNTTGLGIFAASRIKYRSRFGPYHGAVINDLDEAHSEGHLWQIYRDGEASHYLDGSNLEHCNWMRFVNIAPSESEQNVTAFQYRGQIYFKTNRNLTTGQELLIWPWCKSGEVRSAISDQLPEESSTTQTGDLFYSCQGCPDIQFICKKYVLVHKMQRHGRKLSRDWRKEVDQDFSRNFSEQAMNLSDIEFVEMLGDDLDKVPDSVKRLKVVNPGEKRYQCTECNYSSSFKSDFNRHMRDHAGKIRYECVLCDSTYASKAGLEVHVRTHTGEKPFHCTECDSQFASKRSLDRHQVDHKGQKQFQCSMCEYQADSKKVLLSHMRTHTGEKPFQCTYCDFRTAHEHSLNLHIRIHTGEKPYECSVCGFRFNARGDLSKHLKIHSDEKPFQCSACPKRFRRKYHLTEHFRVHTGDKPYRCSVCDERFRCSGQLTNHMRLHTGERLQRCTMCEYTCNTITILNKHLRVHTGEKPFQCTFCDYKCSLKNNLNRHIRGHQGLKPYECHFCDYKTGVRASLTRHVQTHTGEKPFPCTLCDFKGSSRKTLNNHLKRHTGEKPFQCSLCSYKCRIKCSLTRHVNISHNEEKRFPCILCGFKCHDKGVLARHLKAHKSEKGLHCTQCNYKTNSKSAFTYHMRNEHPSK